MARFVRFDNHEAEANWKALPDPARRLVTDKLIKIAERPDPTKAEDLRLISPVGPNSGRQMAMVEYGRYFVMIAYRWERPGDEIWVLAVDRVYGEDGTRGTR